MKSFDALIFEIDNTISTLTQARNSTQPLLCDIMRFALANKVGKNELNDLRPLNHFVGEMRRLRFGNIEGMICWVLLCSGAKIVGYEEKSGKPIISDSEARLAWSNSSGKFAFKRHKEHGKRALEDMVVKAQFPNNWWEYNPKKQNVGPAFSNKDMQKFFKKMMQNEEHLTGNYRQLAKRCAQIAYELGLGEDLEG